MTPTVTLEGERIRLRPIGPQDVREGYRRWMNDPEVNRFMETRHRSQSLDDIRAFVDRMRADPDVHFLAIVLKDGETHVGNIKLGPVSRVHRRAEISFFVGERARWGQGIATEAVRLLTDYGLARLGLLKVTAGAYGNNVGSIRVFEKCGFVREAVLRSHYLCDGTPVDRVYFAKFAPVGPATGREGS